MSVIGPETGQMDIIAPKECELPSFLMVVDENNTLSKTDLFFLK